VACSLANARRRSGDAFPEKVFTGKLTAISPEVDPTTRSVDLHGTIENRDGLLRSGLFVDIELVSSHSEDVLIIVEKPR